MSQVDPSSSLSFSSPSSFPNEKIAPIVVAGAALVGRAVVGGVIGGATSWGTTRFLDNHFPSRK